MIIKMQSINILLKKEIITTSIINDIQKIERVGGVLTHKTQQQNMRGEFVIFLLNII